MRARTTTTTKLAAALAGLLLAPALAVPAGADGGHRVESGETLSEIAAANGTTVRALAEANGISNPNRIVVGQVLVVPGRTSSTPATVVHVVAPGESLSTIARRYATTVRALADANGIANPDLVRIGARLTVPAGGSGGGSSAAPTRTHTVTSGESLAGIAARYGVSQGSIVSANALSNPNLIRIGQVLSIPAAGTGGGSGGSSGGGSGYARTGGADGRTGLSGTHTVLPGETLASIARRYGVTQADLMAANGILPPGNLYADARLRLTAPNRLPPDVTRCPLPGARYANDWGFPRSGGRAHEGNDLFAPRGTPILAPVAGTVSQATGTIGGRQFRLRGDDGITYLGSHMDNFGASGRVRAGDVIGYVGTTGNAAGGTPHLHFEIHPDNGAAMNPYPVLRQACG